MVVAGRCVGPRRCWSSGRFLVSLMPMVLQAVYRVRPRVRALWVVSLQLLSLVLWLAVAEVVFVGGAVVDAGDEALRAILRFTVSLVLLMLSVLLVDLVWVRVWVVSGLFTGLGRLYSRMGAGRSRELCQGGCAVCGVGRW